MHVGMATIFLKIHRRVGNETFVGVDHPLAAHRLDSRAMYWTGRSADAYEGVSAFLEKRPPRFTLRASFHRGRFAYGARCERWPDRPSRRSPEPLTCRILLAYT